MYFAYTYDYILLHTDEEYAKDTPFGQLLAPSVISFMSVWAKYLNLEGNRQSDHCSRLSYK